jgi:RimJ/RimL family protein N-acetyltransferase
MNIKINNFVSKNITKKYLSWLNNDNLLKYSRHKNITYTKKKAVSFYNRILKSGNFFYSIKDISKKKNIGTMIVYKFPKKANIGILIGDKNYHNKGCATKAIKILFKKLIYKKLFNVEIGCNVKNIQMIKVAKKLGFKKNKIYKKNIFFKRKI